ncbi:unnamed protein product [Heterobilharzia americana]|nr:unnamed protein product [Heterobilharzia americana]CAH8529495.1 unnamed protein product [Heterobilharzia americana]
MGGIGCTFKGNILLAAMVDRLLSIFIPLKYGKLPVKYAWYCILGLFLLALSLVVPYALYSNFIPMFGKTICWVTGDSAAWAMYTLLVTDTGFLYTSLNGLLGLVLTIKVYIWIKSRRRIVSQKSDEKSSELSACALTSKYFMHYVCIEYSIWYDVFISTYNRI